MLSGTWPNSPAVLFAPRSSLPSTAIPTPTPSETFTNATGPSTGTSPLSAHTCARMHAFTEFSTTTGSRVAALSGPTRSTSRQPSVGEYLRRPPVMSTRPETATPTPTHDPKAGLSASVRVIRAPSSVTSARGRRPVGNSMTGISGWPSRSVARNAVWLALMSTATAHRWRVSMYRCVGLRPPLLSPFAPSTTRPARSRSFTIRLTAPGRSPISRARSAREIGCFSRTRFSEICRLISRDVPRLAMRKSAELIRRMSLAAQC